MGRPADKDRLKKWFGRINSAERCYKKWQEKFRTEELEGFYDGTGHWSEDELTDGKKRYAVNLCFPTVETKLPSMLFYRPRARVESQPTRSDDMGSTMDRRTMLREATVNTFIAKEEVGFEEATSLALLEAHYRFGVVEVGYSADFIDNPNAGKPILKEGVEVKDERGEAILTPEKTIKSEGIYVKRIPAKQFRVALHGKNRLEHNDWCGYFEWVYTEDIKRNKRYSNTHGLKATGKISKDYDTETTEDGEDRSGMSKLWKIWDLRARKRYDFVEGGEKFLLEEPYDLLPFRILKFHHQLDEFYPIPPLHQWRDVQRALNWTRNKQLEYMSHNDRKYTYVDGTIDEPEIRKLETGGDMAYAKQNSGTNGSALIPVPIPPSDRTLQNNVALTKDDFFHVTGVSAEQRGVAEAETATQASLVDVNSRIRDNHYRVIVAKWLASIADLMLRTIQLRMALPYWIEINVDPLGEAAIQEAMNVAAAWQEITSEELGDQCYEVSVDIESLSPVTEDLRRNQWMTLLGIMSNPGAVMFHLASEDVLKKTLSFHGIRSAKEIGSMKEAMMAVMAALMSQQKPPSGGGAPGEPGPGALPNGPDMAAQIGAQMAAQG